MKPRVITVDGVRELTEKMETEYSATHALFDDDEMMYELDFGRLLGVPKEFITDATVLPTARQLIDTCTDHVDLKNARVTVARKKVDSSDATAVEAAEKAAEMLAKAGAGFLYRSLVEEDISQTRVAAKHLWLHGLGCLKVIFDADRWMNKPRQKAGQSDKEYRELIDEWRSERDSQMPIVLQAVNPRNVYPDPSYSGRGFVIEVRENIMLNVRDNYPKWNPTSGKSDSDKVKLVSYWDKEYRCELADGEQLFPGSGVVKHNYGCIPYVFIESGLGNMASNGDLTKRYVGILRYLKNVLISESRNFSLYDVAMKKGAIPSFTLEGDNADQIPDFKLSYGDGVQLPKGVKMVEHPAILAPDTVMQQVQRINDIISAFAAPRSVQGLGESGVRSAAHARTLADLGGVRFQYTAEAFRNKIPKVLSIFVTILTNLKELEDIRLWSKTPGDEFDEVIDKKKLKAPFIFNVTFAPSSEEAEYIKNDANMKLHHEGIVDATWVRKQMPNVDWKEMEYAEKKKMVEADPAVQQQLGALRSAMVTAAVNREMIKQGVQAAPPPMQSARGIPTGGMPVGDATMNRSLVAPSSPKPLPGSSRSLDLMMKGMERPEPTFQGQNGGGAR